jgi:HSP20 family protein
MDIKKLNPWNWFKHEEDNERRNLPVYRQQQQQQTETPVSAYSPLMSLHQEIDRMFNNAFRSFGLPSLSLGAAAPLAWETNLFRPNVDIDATDKEYRITVEMPGVEESDIRLELSPDGALSIQGEKRIEREEKGHDLYRVERSYGSFQRVLALPEDADRDSINATFKNGVLTVNVSRKATARPEVRWITVKTS